MQAHPSTIEESKSSIDVITKTATKNLDDHQALLICRSRIQIHMYY